MNVSVKFLGAASEVTGSKYLIKAGDFTVLLDCGLFQGKKSLRELNWAEFPVKPSKINAVVVTHAHLDHTGYLPRLFRSGFNGPVYCTAATADLMKLILLDSAKIQVEEANYARKKGYSKHENPQPLYTTEDAELIWESVITTDFENPLKISENITISFSNAGHILGAAIVEMFIRGDKETKKIVFSGDLGRSEDSILYPPKKISEADALFVESTYGDRDIQPTEKEELLKILNDTFERDGNIVIPAFSIGRTQTLLMYIKNILFSKEIPPVKVIVDSPMAIAATGFYRKYQDYHKLRGIDLDEDQSFLTLRKNLTIARTTEESKRINEIKKDSIIISASGMMTGGRVLHHLAQRLPNPKDVILICGYQAEGSRGRKLQDGEKSIKIFGQEISVRAQVHTIKGLSAHADRSELLDWVSGFRNPPSKTFVIHGEAASSNSFAQALREMNWTATVPKYLEEHLIFENI